MPGRPAPAMGPGTLAGLTTTDRLSMSSGLRRASRLSTVVGRPYVKPITRRRVSGRLLAPRSGKARHRLLTLRQPRLDLANWREVGRRVRGRDVDANEQLAGGAETVGIDDEDRNAAGDDLADVRVGEIEAKAGRLRMGTQRNTVPAPLDGWPRSLRSRASPWDPRCRAG